VSVAGLHERIEALKLAYADVKAYDGIAVWRHSGGGAAFQEFRPAGEVDRSGKAICDVAPGRWWERTTIFWWWIKTAISCPRIQSVYSSSGRR